MLNSLSMGAEDAGVQRNLQAILAKGGNFIWFTFQNTSGFTSCGMQGENKYSSTIVFKSLEVSAFIESDSIIKSLKKIFIFLAGDSDSSSICSEISRAKYLNYLQKVF